MDREEIIFRISCIRYRAKLSQKALSINIDCNEGYCNRLESKRNFLPSLSVMMRIIEECGSTPAEFFYTKLEDYKHDMELLETYRTELNFIKSIKELDERSQALVRDLVEALKRK